MASIIIVEDEAIVAMENRMNLNDAGHSIVAVVSSAEAAIKAFDNESPDLMLMDIKLKGEMDGIEAMIIIREKSNIPVVFLTGNSDLKTKERLRNVSNSTCLQKPILTKEIIAEVNKMLS